MAQEHLEWPPKVLCELGVNEIDDADADGAASQDEDLQLPPSTSHF